MSTKVTDEMITAQIREIEEPLITIDELSDALKLSTDIIKREAVKLKIKSYTLYDGQHYKTAYNEDMVKQIIDSRRPQYIRKNKLDITHLLIAD